MIGNAIKFQEKGNIPKITISAEEKNGWTFSIKDNGIGIPEKDQKNIFNRYFRAENALLTQGTGIGLNIVKTHLENLGGSISFSSKEHEGTTFTIVIPNNAE